MQCALSIIIVTWNTKDLTLKSLHSIYTSKDYSTLKSLLEVIVIDNGSDDNTSSAIKKAYPLVSLIKNAHNAGYAPASNMGMRQAKGKYVLLLGSDTEITDGALTECVSFLDKTADAGAVGCRLVYPGGTLQGNCKKFPSLINGIFTYTSLDYFNRNYDMADFKYDKTAQVEQVATTFLMIRSKILKNINYFDERYKILYNDVDLCRKIWNTGFKIYFIHTATVIHHGSYSTNKAPAGVRKIMYSDIYRYYKNNFGLAAVILVPILFIRFIFVSLFK